MATRYYANAPATSLAASCTDVAATIQVDSVAGLPISYPFTLIIDREQATEEAVSVTAAAGTTLTVTRGIDGTTAFAHSLGAEVVHGITAQDVREPNTHINASNGVHGVVGDVVGETDAQTLTNKDLTDPSNTFPATLATDAEVAAVQADVDAVDAALTAHAADTSTHGVATVAGLAEAQTLTNKTIDLADNTVTGTTAEFNAALSDNDFATLDGVETLTNKTLADPVITGVGGVQYAHKLGIEQVTNSAVLQDDGALSFTAEANGRYIVDLGLYWGTQTDATADAKIAFSVPSGTYTFGAIAPSTALSAGTSNGEANFGIVRNGASDSSISFGISTAGNGFHYRVAALIEIAGVGGTVTLRWAQANAVAGVILSLFENSWLKAERIA